MMYVHTCILLTTLIRTWFKYILTTFGRNVVLSFTFGERVFCGSGLVYFNFDFIFVLTKRKFGGSS